MSIRPPVKHHGGKGRLHNWIVGLLPPHETYIEPFGGAASVLLNKPRCRTEIYNELDPDMFNLMSAIQSDFLPFLDRVSAVPYEEGVFFEHLARYKSGDGSPLERAVSYYVSKRMSRAGLCVQFCWSQRVYSTGPAEAQAYRTSLKNLVAVHERLQGVELVNRDAFDVLPAHVGENCLIYLDPPYMASTRVSNGIYYNELSAEDHKRLADLVVPAKARVLLSGYDSSEYRSWYPDWRVHAREVSNHSSQRVFDNNGVKVKKLELVWDNGSMVSP